MRAETINLTLAIALLLAMPVQAEESPSEQGTSDPAGENQDEAEAAEEPMAADNVTETSTPSPAEAAEESPPLIWLGPGPHVEVGGQLPQTLNPPEDLCEIAPWLPSCEPCTPGATDEPPQANPVKLIFVIPWVGQAGGGSHFVVCPGI